MEKEKFEEGSTIFQLGDRGEKFYLILKGSVDIYIPKIEEEEEEISVSEKHAFQSHQRRQMQNFGLNNSAIRSQMVKRLRSKGSASPMHETSKGLNTQLTEHLKRLKSRRNQVVNTRGPSLDHESSSFPQLKFEKKHAPLQEESIKLSKVRSMGPGSYFGEISITSNMPRGATVVAASDLYVATLTKNAYKTICQVVETSLEVKWRFFCELLNNTAKETVTKFCYSFKERSLKFNQKIFEQGQKPTEVFIIRQGEIQMSKHEFEEDQITLKHLRRQKKVLQKKVVNLGSFCFFGENEALSRKPYEYSAMCISNDTVIYSTTLKEFYMLRSRYADAFQNLFDKQKIKDERWNARTLTDFNKITERWNQDLCINDHHSIKNEISFPNNISCLDVHSSKLIKLRMKNASADEDQKNINTSTPNYSKTTNLPINKDEIKIIDHSAPNDAFKIIPNNKDYKTTEMRKTCRELKDIHLNQRNDQVERLFETDLSSEKLKSHSFHCKKKSLKQSSQQICPTEEEGSKISVVIQDLLRNKVFEQIQRRDEIENSIIDSPFPYDTDLKKIKQRTPFVDMRISRKNKKPNLSIHRDDHTISFIREPSTETLDVVGSKVQGEEQKIKEIKLNFLGEFKSAKTKPHSEAKLKKLNNRSLDNSLLSIGMFQNNNSTNEALGDYTQLKEESLLKYDDEKNYPSSKFKSLVRKPELRSTLSTFPTMDMMPVSIRSGGLANGYIQTIYSPIELEKPRGSRFISEEGRTPKAKDPKTVMISSKHNFFRMKPQKAILEYSHYLSPISQNNQHVMSSIK